MFYKKKLNFFFNLFIDIQLIIMLNLNQLNEDNTCARFLCNSIILRIAKFFPTIEITHKFLRYLDTNFVVFGSIIFDDINIITNDLDIMINDKNNQSKRKIFSFMTFLLENDYILLDTTNMYGTMQNVQVSQFQNKITHKKIDIVFVNETPSLYLKKNVDLSVCSGVFVGDYIETAIFHISNNIIKSPIYSRVEEIDIDKLEDPVVMYRLTKYLEREFLFTYQGNCIPIYNMTNDFDLYEHIESLKNSKHERSYESSKEC